MAAKAWLAQHQDYARQMHTSASTCRASNMLLQGSVTYQDELEQGCLVDLDEICIVGFDFIVGLGRLVVSVLL